MSANRYMQVQEVFGKTKERNNLLRTFDDSATYLLAAPSTPREALDGAIERAEAGEKITHNCNHGQRGRRGCFEDVGKF